MTPPAGDIDDILRRAEGRLRAGDTAAAAALYRQAAKRRPDDPRVLRLGGMTAYITGKTAEAVRLLSRYVQVAPSDAGGWVNLGNARQALGQSAEAAAAFRAALPLAPGAAAIHYNLGNALRDCGDGESAIAAYRQALALQPAYPKALSNLGVALNDAGRVVEAVAVLERAVALDPGSADHHGNLATALQGLGRFDEAIAAHRRAIALAPERAIAHFNLGNALREAGRGEEAAGAFRAALRLQPDFAEAHANLGRALQAMGRPAEAMACYQAALAAEKPESSAYIHRNIMGCAVYRDDLDAADLRRLHQDFAARFGASGEREEERGRERGRIRIGYLSSDLRDHPVAGNMMPVIRDHDRAAFAIHLYSLGVRRDAVTDRLRALADGWHDVAGLSDEAIARQIRADGIDILVCLAGRFDDNRLSVCGRRAAPVQISLHDVATSGLAEMDYIIGDRWLLPRPDGEYFSERRLRLPQFYLADPPADLPPPPAVPRRGPPVFCCFNNPAKINATALGLWGRILAALPDARLVLKYLDAYASAELRRRVLAAIGGDGDRVEFITGRDDTARLLARYNDADIALDTFPFSGSTTSFQALAMGVPVVTWPWERMVGRWTAAMLHPLGLDELIAASADGYVAKAVAVARDVESWRRRRGEIREAVATSRLCRSPRWTRHLERLYRAVWRRHLASAR